MPESIDQITAFLFLSPFPQPADDGRAAGEDGGEDRKGGRPSESTRPPWLGADGGGGVAAVV